jgi:hypothetical protein
LIFCFHAFGRQHFLELETEGTFEESKYHLTYIADPDHRESRLKEQAYERALAQIQGANTRRMAQESSGRHERSKRPAAQSLVMEPPSMKGADAAPPKSSARPLAESASAVRPTNKRSAKSGGIFLAQWRKKALADLNDRKTRLPEVW